MLALPVADISLGAQDNGQMPKSTTIRHSYDTLTEGFGVGANGPLLVAVDVKPPAQNDQKSLDQLNQQEQQQQAQEQQQIEQLTQQLTVQLEEEGVPPDQAEEEAQQQATQQVEAQGPSQQQQEQTQQQKEFLKSPGLRSAPGQARRTRSRRPRTSIRSRPATLNNAGTAAAFTAVPNSAPSA